MYSKVIDNILFYISDCITCNLIASIDFQDYVTSVLQPAVLTDQQFFATLYATFLNLKNRDKISHPDAFFKKGAFKNFAKFLGKHLCKSLFFNKVAGLMPIILMPIKTYEETREKADERL